MKFLVICSPGDQSTMDRFAELVPDEAEALRRLRSEGTLLEAWSPGQPGAVLIFEAASESEVEVIVAQLPMAAAGLIDSELTPLHDLGI